MLLVIYKDIAVEVAKRVKILITKYFSRRITLLFCLCYVDSEWEVLYIIVLTDRKTYTLKGLDSPDIDITFFSLGI